MHIPDGLMAPLIAGVGWVLAIVIIGIAVKVLDKRIENRQMTLMAVLAAGIFVAQMLNFPIGGGTTGHLVGTALATILLGPYAGMIIITVILIIQALVFGDGGILAFGLNVLNMAVIGSFVAWFVYRGIPEKFETGRVFAAAWSSVFIMALVCAFQLALSYSISGGDYGISGSIAFPAMTISHILIGIGEGIITSGVILFISQVSPDMLAMPKFFIRDMPKKGVSMDA